MRALDRKLFRDLVRLWGQAVTIALVVACGIASFVTMRGTYLSLVSARDAYYDDRRFGDVFVHVERAPDALAARIADVPGVAVVHTRVVRDILLPVEGMPEPAVGRIVSVPPRGEPPLDALRLRRGRMVEPGRNEEVVVLEAFANAHHLAPGDTLPAVLNGTRRDLHVVGIAMSPEFVFAVGGASFIQDAKRFGVLWMARDAVAPVFRMEGAFDDVVVQVQPGATPSTVAEEIRRLLEPYGVLTAQTRDQQISNHVLDGELQQLSAYAIITPAIFLGVAAFLLNVVLARTLHLQRGQIATLKAVGYTNLEIGLHYAELVAIVVGAGAVLGIALGALLGNGMIALYRPFFKFPDLAYRLDPSVAATGVFVSVTSGLGGALSAVARAVRVPPAEAMRPEAPAVYKKPLLERLGVLRLVGASGRMVARELLRRPTRALLSCVGIAWATAVVIAGYFAYDSLDLLMSLQFDGAQREDVQVTFLRPVAGTVVNEARHLPGVVEVEAQRAVPVRARRDNAYRDVAVLAQSDRAVPLRSVAQWPPRPLEVPASGVAMSRKLAEILGARLGDRVQLEVLEGDRRTVDVVVNGFADDMFGLFVYTSPGVLRQMLGEEGNVTSLLLTVEHGREDVLLRRLATFPGVGSVVRRSEVLAQFREQTEHMWVTTTILTLFGAIIAFGVVYNQARIALSMRARDLASLRVLGFTRAEISAVLLGELAVYVLVGVPMGVVLGQWLMHVIMSTADPESYRMPAFATARTFAFGAVVTAASALVSALAVRKKLDDLDLVGVLKTRE